MGLPAYYLFRFLPPFPTLFSTPGLLILETCQLPLLFQTARLSIHVHSRQW